MPYAFIVFAVALNAVSMSVKPAAASSAELCSIVPSISIGTLADSAEYAASASPSAARPVEDDIFIISSLNAANCPSVPVKSVFAFCMEASKLVPELMASLPKLTTASVAFVIRLPANTPSAFLATSPSPLVPFCRPDVSSDVSKINVPSDAMDLSPLHKRGRISSVH